MCTKCQNPSHLSRREQEVMINRRQSSQISSHDQQLEAHQAKYNEESMKRHSISTNFHSSSLFQELKHRQEV